MESFNSTQRGSILDKAQGQTFDIVIVGGGISGAGAFREAAKRGLKVLLIEQNDFGSATSSSSSKLIHGGLRYLEMMDFGLIFESCKDRKRLLEMTPELVQPLEFLFPVYKGQRRKLWMIYIGTWIYWLLALFRNIGRPKQCDGDETIALSPQLERRGLEGSVRYYDAVTSDTRLTLATVKTGVELGGVACNHAKVTSYIQDTNRINGVVVEDQFTEKKYSIKAKWVLNAIGAWTDHAQIRMTKGVHMIIENNPFQIKQAIVMLSPIDGRVVFIIPWFGHTMIGTTDDDYEKNPCKVDVEKKDLEYLLKTTLAYFPMVQINPDQIISTFAGLRCLKREGIAHPSDISREHVLFSNTPGLLNIAGGKLTSFLSQGEEIIDWIQSHAHMKGKKKSSNKLATVTPHDQMKQPTETLFVNLIRNEMAATIQDLLKYRTLSFYLAKDRGASLIEMASRAIKAELDFSDDELQRQADEYRKEIEKLYV